MKILLRFPRPPCIIDSVHTNGPLCEQGAEERDDLPDKQIYSIAEIAEICNVSKATVSRVINNKTTGVGEETRQRVLRTIRELNYRPNALARSIAIARSNMVGVIIPDVSNFFYPKIIRGITDYMDTRGYSVIVGNSNYDPEREAQQLLSMIDKRVDGIILCSGVSNLEFLTSFRKYKTPLALLGRTFDTSLSDVSIGGDNVAGAYKSASYLIRGGAERIVYVEGHPDVSGSHQRLEGYRRAHEAAGLPVREELLLSGDSTIEYGREAADRLLDGGIAFDAVMTGSDLVAIGMVSQLRRRGVRVPEDVELVGFDNIELASVFEPALSTISKPHYDMAQHLAGQLMRVIEGEEVKFPHTTVEPRLVLRETTRQRSYDDEY